MQSIIPERWELLENKLHVEPAYQNKVPHTNINPVISSLQHNYEKRVCRERSLPVVSLLKEVGLIVDLRTRHFAHDHVKGSNSCWSRWIHLTD